MDKFFTGLGISLILFGSLLVFQRNNPNRVAFANTDNNIMSVEENKTKIPASVIIPSLNINLPIYLSEIKNNKWEVTDKGVSYLKTSVLPGDKGNSVLYGHNWTNLLGNLTKIKTGEKITIEFDDKSKKEFVVTLIQEVNPDDISILNDTVDNRITIYTCSGFLDSKRFVVVALLK
jgi:LPXTG-site transpeptidase (sortase) family protein